MTRAFDHLTKMLIGDSGEASPQERRVRDTLIRAVCFVRFVALAILYAGVTYHGSSGLDPLLGVTVLALITCGLSFTRYYAWAVVAIVLDPIFGVPYFVHEDHGSVYALVSAPIWMVIGPFVSAMVLRPAVTMAFVAATAASFAVILSGVPPEMYRAVESQFLAILCTSTLAIIGNVVRVRGARTIRDERAKVLHSAKLVSLGEMASGVAHELNSPLAAIMLNLEVLRERIRMGMTEPAAMEDRISAALQVVERMGQVISGLRTFAKDAQDEPFISAPARTWIHDALNLCRQRLGHHGVDLRVQEANFASVLKTQPVQLAQALHNVLNNSFEAVVGAEDRWIDLSARLRGGSFELVIVDSGRGIPSNVSEKMFQPFFTTKDYGAGPGLGLSISRGIVQKQGGELLYEPAANTTFVLRLPTTIKSAR